MVAVNTGKLGTLAKIAAYFEVVGSVGESFQRLPPKPRMMDWLAFGASIGKAWAQWSEIRVKNSFLSPTSFFNAPGCPWEPLPGIVWPVIRDNVENPVAIPEFWNGEDGSYVLVEGTIDTVPFRWVQEGTCSEQLINVPFVPKGQRDEALNVLHQKFWAKVFTRQIAIVNNTIEPDNSFDEQYAMTAEIRQLIDRASKFVDHGITRSILLVGLPGAGKSTAIRACVRHLGLRSLRLSAASIKNTRGNYDHGNSAVNLLAVLQMAKPDVLVIDDVDHMMLDAFTLSFLEGARQHCKLILTSCNSVRTMLGAALRPGRFDDIVEFSTMDPSLINRLAHGDRSIAERLSRLPVAYAQCFYDVARALGVEQALAELKELEDRAADIERATKEDGPRVVEHENDDDEGD